jgi:polyhydroxyalkanoate synthesis regulator phasin
MARDDRLKKVQGVGADFLETARAKAEEFLREMSRAGGDTQGRAQGALDDLVVGGKKSTEQFVAAVRKEVQQQLGALGLATKADLAALERRLSGRAGSASAAKAPTRTAGASKPAAKAAGSSAKKGTAANKGAAAKKGATAKKAAPRKAAAAKKATRSTAG